MTSRRRTLPDRRESSGPTASRATRARREDDCWRHSGDCRQREDLVSGSRPSQARRIRASSGRPSGQGARLVEHEGVADRASRSSASPPLIRIPCRASHAIARQDGGGVARIKAQGQATTRTATALDQVSGQLQERSPPGPSGWRPTSTTGRKYRAYRSADRAPGGPCGAERRRPSGALAPSVDS